MLLCPAVRLADWPRRARIILRVRKAVALDAGPLFGRFRRSEGSRSAFHERRAARPSRGLRGVLAMSSSNRAWATSLATGIHGDADAMTPGEYPRRQVHFDIEPIVFLRVAPSSNFSAPVIWVTVPSGATSDNRANQSASCAPLEVRLVVAPQDCKFFLQRRGTHPGERIHRGR